MSALDDRAREILARLPAEARAAEVGVLRAHLSDRLLSRHRRLHLTMVDSWAPHEAHPAAYLATRDDHAGQSAERAAAHRAEAEGRVRRFGSRARILAMTSVEAAALIPPASLDLVFLDADHSEAGVMEDLAFWEPVVKPGGWIGGHDFGNNDPRFDFSGVARAVCARYDSLCVEAGANFTWWVRL